MSDSKFEQMRHALGVQQLNGPKWKKPFRNHYVAGSADQPIWEALVTEGFAKKTTSGSPLTGGDPCYTVTPAGQTAALAGLTFKRNWGYGTPTNA